MTAIKDMTNKPNTMPATIAAILIGGAGTGGGGTYN